VLGLIGRLPSTFVELEVSMYCENDALEDVVGQGVCVGIQGVTSAGRVSAVQDQRITIVLRNAVCAREGDRAILAQFRDRRFRLLGYGHSLSGISTAADREARA